MTKNEELKKYRASLVDTLRFLNESYDKLLVTLSGGALGLSIAFLKDIIKLQDVSSANLLFYAWFAFILSLASVLGRVMFGIEAHRRAIKQVDDGTIYDERVGGKYSLLTRALHIGSASLLLIGLSLLAVFAFLNVGETNNASRKAQTETKASARTEATSTLATEPWPASGQGCS